MPGSPPPRSERLRLLATAIAGRPLDVVIGPAPEAWTDGSTVHVPAGLPRSDEVRTIALQACLVAGGSLDPEVLRALVHRPTVRRRYTTLEGYRALVAAGALLPASVRAQVDHARARSSSSPHTSLELARGGAPVDDPPSWFGVLEPRRVLAAVDTHASPRSIADAAAERRAPGAAAELDDEDDAAGEGLGHGLSNPVGGGGPIGRVLARLLAPVRGRGEGGPPGADAPTHRASACPGASGRRASVSAPLGVTEPASPAAFRASYPEWDARRGRYREDWCTVREVDPPVDATSPVPADHGGALRRPIARLGVGPQPTRRQRQGDDIDVDAAVAARVDHLAGSPDDDALYVESRRRRRDLAVLVLLDVSGSAAEPGTDGRSVHEHQRQVAAQLVGAAHGLGDRVALYGFSSRGRSAVQLLRVKAFDDQLDGQAMRRLDGLAPAAFTRLGAAIRHGTAILEARGGTPRRLLVVLSDGFAYDHGYEGRYGEGDARRSLVEARRRGVGCLCLSVGTVVEPAALRRVFGPAAHATVPRPGDLPRLIGPLFRAALGSAEAQQRVHQRRERVRERLELERRTDARRDSAVLRPGR
jgi:Mg-chelatase subunit ChlD